MLQYLQGGRKWCSSGADKRDVIHVVFPQTRDTNLQHFPPEKDKIIGKIPIK